VLHQLIQSIRSAKLPHHLRHELLVFLSEALHSLGGSASTYGAQPDLPKLAFGEDWKLMRHPFAPLVGKSSLTAVAAHSHHDELVKACAALSKFVTTITHDQQSHKPKIPASLAKEWIQSARGLEAQVGCSKLSSGRSSKHPHGHSSGGRPGHR
jgi:hypothetical protein